MTKTNKSINVSYLLLYVKKDNKITPSKNADPRKMLSLP